MSMKYVYTVTWIELGRLRFHDLITAKYLSYFCQDFPSHIPPLSTLEHAMWQVLSLNYT